MNFKVNIKVCRVCMKSDEGYSLYKDLDLQSKFVFTTRLSLKPSDSLPAIICPKCVIRLKLAYDFVQLAHASEKNLKTFLTKISSDFQEVTKTSFTTTATPTSEDEEILQLFDKPVDTDDNSSIQESKELPKIFPKQEKATHASKKLKQSQMLASSSNKFEHKKPIKETFKEELTELQVDEVEPDVFYYEEDANFLEESENEDTEQKMMLCETKPDEQNKNEPQVRVDNDKKTAEQQQADGYLQEYNDMLAKHDDESIVAQYIFDENSMEDSGEMDGKEEELEDEPESATMTTHVEELHYYEETEELLQVQDEDDDDDENMPTESSEHFVEETDEMNMELDIAAASITAIDAHPIQLSSSTTTTAVVESSMSKSKPNRTQAKQSRSIAKPRKLQQHIPSISARFFCVQCNRDFSTKTNLTRHMATHEGAKPYECMECSKSFSQNGSLKQHMLTHTGEKPFVCEVCNRGFTQCKSLVFHMRRHTGEKPFPCVHCGMYFRQKDGLKTHILKHHMIRQSNGDCETHICIICKKLLSTKYALQAHMRKHVNNHHTVNLSPASALAAADKSLIDLISEDELLNEKSAFVSEELALNIDDVSSSTQIVDTMTANTAKASRVKKFQCRKCYKCFAIKKNLLRHLTTHDVSASELFQCKTCQVAFDTNYALRVHRVREHKEMGINLNECEYCNITFSNAAELSDHNSTVHDVTDQNCPECPDLNFKSQKQLLEHLMEHENLLDEVDDE